jgi:hypothetical protein
MSLDDVIDPKILPVKKEKDMRKKADALVIELACGLYLGCGKRTYLHLIPHQQQWSIKRLSRPCSHPQ